MKKIIAAILAASILIFMTAGVQAGEQKSLKQASLKPNRIQISYVPPTNPAHQPIYELFKERRVLEGFQESMSPLRLPRTLLLKMDGCDGESNSWYDDSEYAVIVCYEYIEEILHYAPKETTPAGVTRLDAIIGPTVEVFLHEASHGLFDLLKIPILGREEDAADQVAAYLLLQLGKEYARKTVLGVAFMYGHEAREQNVKAQNFADVHGFPAQRFYNLLCMAYGADPILFADVVEKGYLPKSRAEDCPGEYRQVAYAVRTLIQPHTDKSLEKKVKAKKMLRRDSIR